MVIYREILSIIGRVKNSLVISFIRKQEKRKVLLKRSFQKFLFQTYWYVVLPYSLRRFKIQNCIMRFIERWGVILLLSYFCVFRSLVITTLFLSIQSLRLYYTFYTHVYHHSHDIGCSFLKFVVFYLLL